MSELDLDGLQRRILEAMAQHGSNDSADLKIRVSTLSQLIAAARELETLRQAARTIVCSFCGEVTNRGPTHDADTQLMVDHIMKCEKHPMMRLLGEAEALKLLEEAMAHIRASGHCGSAIMETGKIIEWATELGWKPEAKGSNDAIP